MTGWVHFVDRGVWFLLHTLAQRIYDLNRTSACVRTVTSILLQLFKTVVLGFAKAGQSCPLCREHFLSQVSSNDRDAESVNASEALLYYPIDWLLLGGVDGTIDAKLATVVDPASLVLFVWKLHNAVTSSVQHGRDCRPEETWDTQLGAAFMCDATRYPRQHRAWPFLRRYEFDLADYDLWRAVRASVASEAASVNALDRLGLRTALWEAWHARNPVSPWIAAAAQAVMMAISVLDARLLASQVFESHYTLASLPTLNCTALSDIVSSLGRLPLFVESSAWPSFTDVGCPIPLEPPCDRSAAASPLEPRPWWYYFLMISFILLIVILVCCCFCTRVLMSRQAGYLCCTRIKNCVAWQTAQVRLASGSAFTCVSEATTTAASGDARAQPALDNQSQGLTPLPLGWSQVTTDDGFTYYFNQHTGQSSWERPR